LPGTNEWRSAHQERSDHISSEGGRRKPAKEISPTDLQAAWVARKSTDPFSAYDANYLVAISSIRLAREPFGVDNSPALRHHRDHRVKSRFDLRPRWLAGDTVYGAARLLKWLVDRGITPHIPVWDTSARSDGPFNRSDFRFQP
jgi:hypothetical protein